MNRKILTVFLLLLLPLFSGCDPFQLPKGTWVCEELNMTLKFVYRERQSAVGTMVRDDETLEIVCILHAAGEVTIGHLTDTAEDIFDFHNLYRGQFRHKGKNKMHLIISSGDTPNEDNRQKEYTFIKLEDPEANAPLFPEKADDSGPSGAIFGRDGKIWFYNAKTNAFSVLGSDLVKYGPVLSPKGDKILFRVDVADTQDVTQQVGLLHTDGSGERLFSIGHAGTNQLLSLTWIDNQRFLAQYHVNPSTKQVFVVDAESGETLAIYAGLHFQLLDDGRVVYMDNVPHGFSDMAHYKVAIDGAIVYTSPVKGKPITALTVFEDGA